MKADDSSCCELTVLFLRLLLEHIVIRFLTCVADTRNKAVAIRVFDLGTKIVF